MAYSFDSYDNSLVISGWEKGIADSPHQGISDMRNVNIISIPGEASVNFATAQANTPTINGTVTVTGLSASAISFAAVAGLENGMAIQFTGVGSLSGVSTNTTYWVYNCLPGSIPYNTTSCQLYSTYSAYTTHTNPVTITGTAGGATFTVYNVGNGSSGNSISLPKYFTYISHNSSSSSYRDKTFCQDGVGQVWSNAFTTISGYWTFTGRSGSVDTGGFGLVYYQAKDGTGFVFAFSRK